MMGKGGTVDVLDEGVESLLPPRMYVEAVEQVQKVLSLSAGVLDVVPELLRPLNRKQSK